MKNIILWTSRLLWGATLALCLIGIHEDGRTRGYTLGFSEGARTGAYQEKIECFHKSSYLMATGSLLMIDTHGAPLAIHNSNIYGNVTLQNSPQVTFTDVFFEAHDGEPMISVK